MAGYSDRSDPGEQAVTSGVVAALALAGAAWVGWMLGWPWVFDMNDPDFNPMILLEGLLIAVAAWHVVKAMRWRARSRAFGTAEIRIAGRTPVPPGSPLSGVLRFGRPVVATGDWTLTLTCFDIHETRNTRGSASSPYRQDAYPVWSRTILRPADTDTAGGLAFGFQLPDSVGPKPVPPMQRKNAHFSFTASVNIPGLKRVVSHNAPPVARRWNLLVTVSTPGPAFRVAFPLPVED
ncbi:MAG TPA: hypothetical protein PKD10_01955 [Paracoccaceae bacterium]|nr:hypothetical protein [Paracoccaceae bacterium]HMO72996.1 hypothetical protein [Paracoccaceae bacterium]